VHKPGDTMMKTWRLHATLTARHGWQEGVGQWDLMPGAAFIVPVDSSAATVKCERGDDEQLGAVFIYSLLWPGDSGWIELKRGSISENLVLDFSLVDRIRGGPGPAVAAGVVSVRPGGGLLGRLVWPPGLRRKL
jgi:hypothetical protein